MKISKVISIILIILIIYLMIETNGFANAMVFVFAIMIHEGFHYISAMFLKEKISLPTIGALGLRFEIRIPRNENLKWVVIYLAGSFGNIFCAFSAVVSKKYLYIHNADMFIFYNLLMAFINLIPAFPMDMARALCCILSKCYGVVKGVNVVSLISELIAYAMFSVGMYIFIFKSDNMILMILSVMIFYYTEKQRQLASEEFVRGKIKKLADIKIKK